MDWLKLARSEAHVEDDDVLVDRFGVNFHVPEKMKSHMDMVESSVDECAEEGVRPCGECFPGLLPYYNTVDHMDVRRV